jgi:glycosyltransferase involved in cell wall biosynthesis
VTGTPGLRVAIFTESYLPYLSGVTVSTETLARGLGAAGHRVLLVAPRPAAGVELGGELAGAGAGGPDPEYAWLPSYQAPPPAPSGYRMPVPAPSDALRRAREFGPQVVHAQSPFVSGLMARRLAQRLGAPLIFTHHTRFADYRHYLGPLARPGARAVEAYLRDFWGGCAAVVAPGSELADEIRARLGERRRPVVRVIPTGVSVAEIQSLAPTNPRDRFGWLADAVVAVSVGRLAAEKSVALLVEAFARAATADPRLHLLLVGGGPAEAALRRRAAAADLDGRVGITGRVPRPEALSLARGSDLFVFASRTETQGLVLAEALTAGLPVVALAGPGVEDSVRDGIDGVVVRGTSEGELGAKLAEAIGDLAADPEMRRRLASAAAAEAARFDVAGRIEEVVRLYNEVLAGDA